MRTGHQLELDTFSCDTPRPLVAMSKQPQQRGNQNDYIQMTVSNNNARDNQQLPNSSQKLLSHNNQFSGQQLHHDNLKKLSRLNPAPNYPHSPRNYHQLLPPITLQLPKGLRNLYHAGQISLELQKQLEMISTEQVVIISVWASTTLWASIYRSLTGEDPKYIVSSSTRLDNDEPIKAKGSTTTDLNRGHFKNIEDWFVTTSIFKCPYLPAGSPYLLLWSHPHPYPDQPSLKWLALARLLVNLPQILIFGQQFLKGNTHLVETLHAKLLGLDLKQTAIIIESGKPINKNDMTSLDKTTLSSNKRSTTINIQQPQRHQQRKPSIPLSPHSVSPIMTDSSSDMKGSLSPLTDLLEKLFDEIKIISQDGISKSKDCVTISQQTLSSKYMTCGNGTQTRHIRNSRMLPIDQDRKDIQHLGLNQSDDKPALKPRISELRLRMSTLIEPLSIVRSTLTDSLGPTIINAMNSNSSYNSFISTRLYFSVVTRLLDRWSLDKQTWQLAIKDHISLRKQQFKIWLENVPTPQHQDQLRDQVDKQVFNMLKSVRRQIAIASLVDQNNHLMHVVQNQMTTPTANTLTRDLLSTSTATTTTPSTLLSQFKNDIQNLQERLYQFNLEKGTKHNEEVLQNTYYHVMRGGSGGRAQTHLISSHVDRSINLNLNISLNIQSKRNSVSNNQNSPNNTNESNNFQKGQFQNYNTTPTDNPFPIALPRSSVNNNYPSSRMSPQSQPLNPTNISQILDHNQIHIQTQTPTLLPDQNGNLLLALLELYDQQSLRLPNQLQVWNHHMEKCKDQLEEAMMTARRNIKKQQQKGFNDKSRSGYNKLVNNNNKTEQQQLANGRTNRGGGGDNYRGGGGDNYRGGDAHSILERNTHDAVDIQLEPQHQQQLNTKEKLRIQTKVLQTLEKQLIALENKKKNIDQENIQIKKIIAEMQKDKSNKKRYHKYQMKDFTKNTDPNYVGPVAATTTLIPQNGQPQIDKKNRKCAECCTIM